MFLGIGLACRDPRFERGDLRLRLGDGGLLVLKRQFQLRRVQLLRFRPEFRVSVILNLAFQSFDQGLEFDDEGVLLGHHRLLVLALARSTDSSNCIAANAFLTSGGRSGNRLRSKG